MPNVSTSPVVTVTSRIHSFSRCSLAGLACTPMLATWPPGRMSSVASSNVWGTPTASIATSAPSPPVSSITRSTASSRLLLIVVSAPKRMAPSRPGADDRHGVTGRDGAGEHADLIGGGEDVGEEQDLLVAQTLRDLVDRVVGERHARELGLQPVDQVAEDPATAGSVPQIVDVSILTTMSVGSTIAGSATESQLRSPGPWYTRAFMAAPSSDVFEHVERGKRDAARHPRRAVRIVRS
jgi:hypothetical protein